MEGIGMKKRVAYCNDFHGRPHQQQQSQAQLQLQLKLYCVLRTEIWLPLSTSSSRTKDALPQLETTDVALLPTGLQLPVLPGQLPTKQLAMVLKK